MFSATKHYSFGVEEGEAHWFLGALTTTKASGALTGNSMSAVEFVTPPPFATPLHVHHLEDEALYILQGALRGVCGDQQWHAEAGSFVWLPREVPHGFMVVGDNRLRMLVIALPSGFDRFVAEAGAPAPQRVLPPPAAPDVGRMIAVGQKYGQTVLGPLNLD